MIIHRKIQKRSHTILCHNKMQRFMRNTANWNDMKFQRRGIVFNAKHASDTNDQSKHFCGCGSSLPDTIEALVFTISHWWIHIRGRRYGKSAVSQKLKRARDYRSEGFPRTRITKRSCACDCGDLFLLARSSFFLLLSPESRLIIKIFCWKKRCFRRCPGRVKMKKKKDENTWKNDKKWKNGKMKNQIKNSKTKNEEHEKTEKWRKRKFEKMKKLKNGKMVLFNNNWKKVKNAQQETTLRPPLQRRCAMGNGPIRNCSVSSAVVIQRAQTCPRIFRCIGKRETKASWVLSNDCEKKLTTKMPTWPFAQYLHQNIELEATPSVKNCVSKIFNIHQNGNWSIIKFNATGSEWSIIKLRAMGSDESSLENWWKEQFIFRQTLMKNNTSGRSVILRRISSQGTKTSTNSTTWYWTVVVRSLGNILTISKISRPTQWSGASSRATACGLHFG